jgi:hypothetical protein
MLQIMARKIVPYTIFYDTDETTLFRATNIYKFKNVGAREEFVQFAKSLTMNFAKILSAKFCYIYLRYFSEFREIIVTQIREINCTFVFISYFVK